MISFPFHLSFFQLPLLNAPSFHLYLLGIWRQVGTGLRKLGAPSPLARVLSTPGGHRGDSHEAVDIRQWRVRCIFLGCLEP